jgi:hypothetical protein
VPSQEQVDQETIEYGSVSELYATSSPQQQPDCFAGLQVPQSAVMAPVRRCCFFSGTPKALNNGLPF